MANRANNAAMFGTNGFVKAGIMRDFLGSFWVIFLEIFDILSYVTSQKVASNLKFFIFLEMVENTLMILDVGSAWDRFGLVCFFP